MKRIILLLYGLLFLIPVNTLAAGSASISGPITVTNGASATVTVTLHNTAAWNIKIVGSGATSGCSQSYADVTVDGNNTTKQLTLTCIATSVGTLNFEVTGDITSSDGTNSNVNLHNSVTVVAPREKETESRLGSLSISGYEINFDKDKTDYSISVAPTVTTITINAVAKGAYASVIGTGTKELEEEGGNFVVTCIAENGEKKDYTINVSIIDDNPIIAKINNKEYTVVKTNRYLTPPINYTEEYIKIADFDIPAYKNEKTKLTIVGVKDKDGHIYYAIYDNDNYKLYNENKSANLLLYISDKQIDSYKEIKLKINGKEYSAYEIDERFSFVYAMNINTGEYNYYKYDEVENTFQYFDIENMKKNNINVFLIITIVLVILCVCLLVYIVYPKIKFKKRKKVNKN